MRIEVYRNSELFISFQIEDIPGGFSEQEHRTHRCTIQQELELVQRKVGKILKDTSRISYALVFESKMNSGLEAYECDANEAQSGEEPMAQKLRNSLNNNLLKAV